VLNDFLATLPNKDLPAIEPWLEPIVLERGQVLWETGDTRRYLYFPTTAVIYLLYETSDGLSAEIGMIGRRGIAGLTSIVGGAEELARAVVEREGKGFRIESARARAEFAKGGSFQDLMLCFTQSLINQISLMAVCNRLHSIDKRLCRWLLRNQDSQQRGIFEATQAQIATILGVRRESISVTVSRLEQQGLINGSRGKIKILDQDGVEAIACECYVTMKMLHDKMISSYLSSRPT